RFADKDVRARDPSAGYAGVKSLSSLIGFIDETRQLLRKCNAQELRGLEIDGDLDTLDRHRVERQQPVPIENAVGKQAGFPADIAIVDGHAEQRSQACEFR